MAYYITGDCHGKFDKIERFCNNYNTSNSDVMIILGDVGINFWLNKTDKKLKQKLAILPITLFCVAGNHEERPFNIPSYEEKLWQGGVVYFEAEFPNLLFAKDGEIYEMDNKRVLVIGGAYSVDKDYRLIAGIPWFEDEQPSIEIKKYVEQKLKESNWKVDYVLSHTCPLRYEPRDLFLDFITQSKVDKSTEKWLSEIEEKLDYEKWYFGHFHDNREYLRSELLFEGIKKLGGKEFLQCVGRPKYKLNELVLFNFDDGHEMTELYGRIVTVDSYGTHLQPNEVSYDIAGPDNILYKHVKESDVSGLWELQDVEDV